MHRSRTTARLRVIEPSLRPLMRGWNNPEQAWATAVQPAQQSAGVDLDPDDRQWVEGFGFLISCLARVLGLAAALAGLGILVILVSLGILP